MQITIRKIEQGDNAAMAKIIRNTLEEYNCALPGTAYYDKETDHLSEAYTSEQTTYFVAEVNGKIAGGSGIGFLEGETTICELQKMYVSAEYRGLGIANQLMDACLDFAKNVGFTTIYLETKKELSVAVPWYKKRGFQLMEGAIGNTGHFSCEIKMVREL